MFLRSKILLLVSSHHDTKTSQPQVTVPRTLAQGTLVAPRAETQLRRLVNVRRNPGRLASPTMEALRDPSSITERQKQVITLIAEGRSNEEVGRELGISPRTAKAHCDTLRLKLGVPRRRQIPLAYRRLTGDDPLAKSLDSA
jgi:DNA-binding CsgD family transcriptional regulator